jgi:hypothetical protein
MKALAAAGQAAGGVAFELEQPRPGWRPGKDVAGVVRAALASQMVPQTRGVVERVVTTCR